MDDAWTLTSEVIRNDVGLDPIFSAFDVFDEEETGHQPRLMYPDISTPQSSDPVMSSGSVDRTSSPVCIDSYFRHDTPFSSHTLDDDTPIRASLSNRGCVTLHPDFKDRMYPNFDMSERGQASSRSIPVYQSNVSHGAPSVPFLTLPPSSYSESVSSSSDSTSSSSACSSMLPSPRTAFIPDTCVSPMQKMEQLPQYRELIDPRDGGRVFAFRTGALSTGESVWSLVSDSRRVVCNPSGWESSKSCCCGNRECTCGCTCADTCSRTVSSLSSSDSVSKANQPCVPACAPRWTARWKLNGESRRSGAKNMPSFQAESSAELVQDSPDKKKPCHFRMFSALPILTRKHAVMLLTDAFTKNPNPSIDVVRGLSRQCGWTTRQIQDWFSNERRRLKKRDSEYIE